MTTVPKGWDVLPLSEVLQTLDNGRLLQQGWSPRCLTHPAADEETWAVVKTTAIQAGWFDQTQNKELPAGLAARPGIEILEGDLLLTCAGPRSRCGVPALVRRTRPRLMMSGKMYRFRPLPFVDARYLELWLLSPEAQAQIDKMKTGISDSGLNLTQDRFLGLPVPTPSIEVQRKIVEVLEDHLSRLDAADGYLGQAERRTVGAEESWLRRLALAPAAEMTTVGSELREARGGWSRSARHLVSQGMGVQYLKMNNISRRGVLDLREMVYVEATAGEVDKYALRPGDVLFNSKNSGDLIGKTALADQRVSEATFNENIMRLRFTERVDPEFAVMWFLGPVMRSAVRSAASASTNVAAVYKHQLVQMPLWVPSLETQRSLVTDFKSLRESLSGLAQACATSRLRSSALRRGLLTAAFEGKLTESHVPLEPITDLVHAG